MFLNITGLKLMTTTILTCHDTGNTNVLLATAKHLLTQNHDADIKFLVIGEAANTIFNKPENAYLASRVIRVTSWLEEKDFSMFGKRPLTEAEMKIIATNLAALKPVAAITGCSCGPEALAPFQIAKLLTAYLPVDTNYIYNGDFFQDLKNNPFWACLSEEWIVKLSLMVAFTTAVQQAKAMNEKVNCYLTGSSELDKVLEAKTSAEELARIRDTLEVSLTQELIFIAGSKFIDDDLKLLNCLAQSMQKHPGAALRMGMHPGTSDAPAYVEKILGWLDEKKIANFKLVVNEAISLKLTAQLRANEYIKISAISGDQTFPAINALASSQPSTMSTQAVMRQLPSYCLEEYKPLSYMAAFFAPSAEALFQKQEPGKQLDKTKVGLPEGRAVEIISDMLTTVSRVPGR
jgi:hypothetical protein